MAALTIHDPADVHTLKFHLILFVDGVEVTANAFLIRQDVEISEFKKRTQES
jgi:hypothetical protein